MREHSDLEIIAKGEREREREERKKTTCNTTLCRNMCLDRGRDLQRFDCVPFILIGYRYSK